MAELVEAKRRGGREARRALRAAPLEEAQRPVRGGLPGGRYRPLDEADLLRIHRAALDVLETVGLADPIPSCVELCTARGAFLNDAGRLCFPRALVEDTIARAPKRIVVCGQDTRFDLELGGGRVHFATAGAAVHTVDEETGEYRLSTLRDLHDAARLADALEYIDLFQRPVVCRDLEDPRELDLNTLYACIAGTAKPVGTSFTLPGHLAEGFAMLHAVAGSEEAWRARPFVTLSSCFVVPPLKCAEDACRVLEVAVRGGMPVLLLAAGQAGATSPASLAGAVVQEMAEVLAGLVYVHAIREGAPAILGPWPFVSDLRTGAMSGGSGEQALLMAACAQMGRFYDLPTGVAAGMTDSKLSDEQAGIEIGINHALVANAGADLVYEAAGMRASLLGFSHVGMVVDHDSIGAALRTVRGIETDDDSLSVGVIREVCLEGPGHFLGHTQTLSLMQSGYVYPVVGDRSSPKEWVEKGSTRLVDRAARKTREILARHFPAHLPRDVDRELRRRFPVRLAAEAVWPAAA
jgi:trimethylamine--corrinoid protein Co-methyltransferase